MIAIPRIVWTELITCVCTLCFLASLNAQSGFHVGYKITEEQGLPGRIITAMAEDTFGFTWMGGWDGLARYDGLDFKTFKQTTEITSSLIDNRVRCLLTDGTRLWIGTQNGVSVLDLLTEKFTNYQFDRGGKRRFTDQTLNQQINSLCKDQHGKIWIGTASLGAFHYDPEKDDFYRINIDSVVIPAYVLQPQRLATVLDFCPDIRNRDILWIGLFAGMMKLNTRTYQYELFTFPFDNKEEQINRNAFRTLHQHTDGKIYAGAWYNVLQTFDPHTGELTSLPQEFIREHNMQDMSIREIHPATDSTLWITTNMGVLTYHPGQNAFINAWQNDDKKEEYYAVDFIDSQGRIYSFSDQGVTCYDPSLQHFISVSFAHLHDAGAGLGFYAMYDERNKRYIIPAGNTRHLYHFNPRSVGWHTTPLPDMLGPSSTSYTLRNIAPLGNDLYIIAASHSLYLYDALKDEIRHAPVKLPVEVPRIHNVYVDSRNNAWISTALDGVVQWNTVTGAIRQHKLSFDTEFGAGNEDTFLEDRHGRLWIKCRNAFVVYEPERDTLLYYTPEDLVTPFYTTFAEDSKGQMWLASSTGWVGRVDLDLPELIAERYDLGEMAEGMVTIQMDPNDHLWCAFRDRLVRLDCLTGKTSIHPYSPALKASNFFYMKYMPDGYLVFTAKDKIFLVSVQKFQYGTRHIVPYLSQIQIREQPLASDRVAHRLTQLTLKPHENFFSISFSALGFLHGESYRFRYRLRGFQDEWITVTDRRFANFTNVPSGEYTFELQVAGGTGDFSPTLYTLPITIKKKFWEKWWVRLTGIFFVLGFIHSLYRYQIHQIKKEEKLKTEFQHQLDMAETHALRAQMNPHFIFNSLNSIENYILKNDTDKAAAYLNDFAKLIRLILQNSRAKKISLSTELETLKLYLEMEALRFGEKFEYHIHLDSEIDADQIEIPPMLIQPYIENAIWHGIMPKESLGKISIGFFRQDHTLEISIEDNGIGRKRSAEIKTKKNQTSSDSLGMSITQDRIELLNRLHHHQAAVDIIDLIDEEGRATGTRVDITIPV